MFMSPPRTIVRASVIPPIYMTYKLTLKAPGLFCEFIKITVVNVQVNIDSIAQTLRLRKRFQEINRQKQLSFFREFR